MDTEHPQHSSQVRTIDEAGTSEHPDPLILGNHEELHGVQEISINYTSSRELFDRKTTMSTHASQLRLLETS